MHYIPRQTKVKSELLPHVTFLDLFLGAIFAVMLYFLLSANFQYNILVALVWLSFAILMFIPLADGQKMYYTLVLLFKFMAYNKKYSVEHKKGYAPMKLLIPYEDIIDEKIISFGSYYGMAIEVSPVEFAMLSEDKQNSYLNAFSSAISRVAIGEDFQLVKITKQILMDDYILADERKYDSMLKMQARGEISQEEVEARSVIFETRVAKMLEANESNKQYGDYYYLVVYDMDKKALQDTVDGMINALGSSQTPINARVCKGSNLAVFLKSVYTKEFDERECQSMGTDALLKWLVPQEVKFKTMYTVVDGVEYCTFNITDYPLTVGNGWLFPFTSMPNTKVVMNVKPIGRFEAEKMLDKAIMEMETKVGYSSRESKRIENQTHLQTLRDLLVKIKNSNENLFSCNIHITCESYMKKEMRALLKEYGFKFSENFGKQVDSFICSNISRLDTMKSSMRGINTTSLSACFPFISSAMADPSGFYIGYNGHGNVFIDFFRRDSERVNSNMMIIGKSGGGKSFATKNLLANFSGDNSKIFVLDPEYEYATLAENLHGKVLDVGTGLQGRINPFHITPSLKAEEGIAEQDDYASHLQFLEQYFKVILSGMDSDAFETVNSLVIDMYKKKGIDSHTDLNKLKAEDFPIFDDLYSLVIEKIKNEKDEYMRRMYQIIETYVQKFATGGRNANLWNGPTTLETKENFCVFSFRSLLANQNSTLANAQMLLVLRYLNNEMIKNKDFNEMMGYGESDPDRRKIIIAVDEAHVFIDPKFPIALNFMEQLAKRIRKYSGMQIIITQNIKDFVGSAEIQKQSTAIINASQFTMVLSLAPNDMTDLVDLYRNAGGINEDEQQTIVQAQRGEAFLITSPLARTFLKIEAFDPIREMFQVNGYLDKYFAKDEDDTGARIEDNQSNQEFEQELEQENIENEQEFEQGFNEIENESQQEEYFNDTESQQSYQDDIDEEQTTQDNENESQQEDAVDDANKTNENVNQTTDVSTNTTDVTNDTTLDSNDNVDVTNETTEDLQNDIEEVSNSAVENSQNNVEDTLNKSKKDVDKTQSTIVSGEDVVVSHLPEGEKLDEAFGFGDFEKQLDDLNSFTSDDLDKKGNKNK